MHSSKHSPWRFRRSQTDVALLVELIQTLVLLQHHQMHPWSHLQQIVPHCLRSPYTTGTSRSASQAPAVMHTLPSGAQTGRNWYSSPRLVFTRPVIQTLAKREQQQSRYSSFEIQTLGTPRLHVLPTGHAFGKPWKAVTFEVPKQLWTLKRGINSKTQISWISYLFFFPTRQRSWDVSWLNYTFP